MRRFSVLLPAAITLWNSAAIAQGLIPNTSARFKWVISAEEAKKLVHSVDTIAQEFSRNSTCTLEVEKPDGIGCDFHVLRISCTPAKNDSGMVKLAFVNKANADVMIVGNSELNPIREHRLLEVQSNMRKSHSVSANVTESARAASVVGCME